MAVNRALSPDIELDRRQIIVRHSGWNGELTAPKNGRIRYVGMTERLATALRKHRHLGHRRVLCKDDGTPLTRQGCWSRVRYAAHRAKVPTGVHILRHTFCSHKRRRRAVRREREAGIRRPRAPSAEGARRASARDPCRPADERDPKG
jgi:hypothetical protein